MFHNFNRLYSIYSCYKMLAMFSMLYSISFKLILYLIVCTSYSPTLIFPLPIYLEGRVFSAIFFVAYLVQS